MAPLREPASVACDVHRRRDMSSHLPHLPGSEPLDVRILVGFCALLVLLLAPAAVALFSPTSRGESGDDLSALESAVREAGALVDIRDRTPNAYFRSQLEVLAQEATDRRNDMLHRPYAADAGVPRSRYLQLAARFVALTDALTTADASGVADANSGLNALLRDVRLALTSE
jgi:hypothetical protein